MNYRHITVTLTIPTTNTLYMCWILVGQIVVNKQTILMQINISKTDNDGLDTFQTNIE